MIFIFAALLINSMHKICVDSVGHLAAWCGIYLLMFTDAFFELSVSVMIGLPSLAFAMVSIMLLMRCLKSISWLSLAMSAGLLALSMQTKFFTALLIPILVAVLWVRLKSFRITLVWLSIVLVVYAFIGLASGSLSYAYLVAPHVDGAVRLSYDESRGWAYLVSLAGKNIECLVLALVGTIVVFVRRRYDGLLPLAWVVVASIILAFHRPIWYHHYLLIAIPMAWLASYSILPLSEVIFEKKMSWEFLRAMFHKNKRNGLVVGSLMSVLLVLASFGMRLFPLEYKKPAKNGLEWKMVERVKQYQKGTRWVFSDCPMIPFDAGLVVPPTLAVLSQKRFVSGSLDLNKLHEILVRFAPEQIVLSNRQKEIYGHAGIREWLGKNYIRTYSEPDYNRKKGNALEHYLIKSHTLAP